MPDITSVLERAAAAPAGAPDLDGPRRRQRVLRMLTAGGVCLAAVIVFAVMLQPARTKPRVTTSHPAAQPSATRVQSHDAAIDVLPGWYVAPEPLAWWLHSPFELFSIATSSLPPAPHKQANEAACASEIPQVAVDGIAGDGAYLWIGEWRPHEGLYEPSPRPSTSDGLVVTPGCALPRGEQSYIGVFRDGAHDYSVTYVLGKDAPPSRKADIDRMLDSLQFDQ